MTALQITSSGDRNGVACRATVQRVHFWTTREQKILRENYTRGGIEACLALLDRRSEGSIRQQAAKLGLRRPAEARKKWATSPQMDDVIRRAFQGEPHKNMVNDLAVKLGRPRYWVSQRAARLGLVAPRFKEPDWTPEELALLEKHAAKTPRVISRIFKRNGFQRSVTAIVVKSKRLQLDREDPDFCTASSLAVMLGCDAKVVTHWIDRGLLKARAEPVGSADGDRHRYRIHWADVKAFIIDNAAAVDLRKVDKFWFIDLMARKK